MKCERCGKTTSIHTMSMFNTQDICMDCKEAERKLPEYAQAEAADVAAITRGQTNFKGVGLPEDRPAAVDPDGSQWLNDGDECTHCETGTVHRHADQPDNHRPPRMVRSQRDGAGFGEEREKDHFEVKSKRFLRKVVFAGS